MTVCHCTIDYFSTVICFNYKTQTKTFNIRPFLNSYIGCDISADHYKNPALEDDKD